MAAKGALQTAMKKAIELAPDAWVPGGRPDPLIDHKHGRVGTQVSRLDGPLKVAGAARFAAEFPLPGMAYAALAYSTIPKGRIATLDTTAAEAASGVVLVMTHRNAPRMKAMPAFMTAPKAAGGSDLPIMQDDAVHWNGQPIALVLADTQEQADHAASLIAVTYEAAPALTDFDDAKPDRQPAQFQGEPMLLKIGDAEATLAAAPHRIDRTYRTPRHNHNPIELHAATLAWEGDTLVLHDASQCVAHTAWSLAQVFDIAEAQVHVTSPFVGGGFGSKTLWQHQVLAAAAAKLARRPVRIVLSREGVYRIVGGRTLTEQRVAIGARGDGHFTAIVHTGVVAMTAHNNMPEPFILGTRSGYAADTFLLDVEAVKLDMLANTFMRAPGESIGTYRAGVCARRTGGRAMQLDPIELRIGGSNPRRTRPVGSGVFVAPHLVEAYRSRCGAIRLGPTAPRTPRMQARGRMADRNGLSRPPPIPITGCRAGRRRLIRLTSDGRCRRIEMASARDGNGHRDGAGTNIAAERLGLPLDHVDIPNMATPRFQPLHHCRRLVSRLRHYRGSNHRRAAAR